MGINVETVIMLYITVSISMILFNCFLIPYRKHEYRLSLARKKRIGKLVDIQLKQLANGETISAEVQQQLARKLTNRRNLMAFHEAILPILEANEPLLNDYLSESMPLFVYLAEAYAKQNNTSKAYFAYLLAEYKLGKEQTGDDDVLSEIILSYVTSNSVYCRENALRALFSFGNANNVVRALMLLSQNQIYHNTKTIADGLATFAGNDDELISLLMLRWDELDRDVQIAVINYIKFTTDAYSPQLFERLINPKTDKEIKLTLIRYFRKHHYEPAREVLLDYVNCKHCFDWEYIAVAALALDNYPGEETTKALKEAMFSPNWYVRFNASESLKHLKVGCQELDDIYRSGDRYAKEMLRYRGYVDYKSARG